MAKNNKEKSYWPHMILGFLMLGITLSYWTVKSASSIPVQESNEYMLKYQVADYNINEIIEKKQVFDRNYDIKLSNVKTMVMKDNINSKVKQPDPVALDQGMNSFTYLVVAKDGTVVSDANVSFLLTRPHTVKDDNYVETIPFSDGKYLVKDINISEPGRYTLQLRAKIGEAVGYSQLPAYLKP
jgi:hypothetical protein